MVNTPEIGSDIKWVDIIRQVFRVLEFDRAGTTTGPGDTIKATSRFKPYGYLLVEAPIFKQPIRLPIVHRDDFLLATTVFDEPRLVDLITNEEMLVTYAPKQHLPTGQALGTSHVLHYVIVPRGTLEDYYEEPEQMIASDPKQLFGEFVYEGEIKVQVNPEPLLDHGQAGRIHQAVLARQEDGLKGDVDAEENRLAEEFDKLVAEERADQKSEEKLEWLRNEKAAINREKIKLELQMAKAFRDLNPDSPETFIEDLLNEFRGSNAKEGTSAKYCCDALIAWRQGDRETALQLFTKAVELDPDDGVAFLNRGNLQLEMGRFKVGLADLDRAREIAPELPCQNADIMRMLDNEEREAWR